MGKLSVCDFLQVVQNTPLIALDLIIQDPTTHKILLGYRKHEPAKDTWFVPGGRIYKNETIECALQRVLKDELGVCSFSGEYKIASVSNHIYDTCFYEENPLYTNTHYVVIGIQINIDSSTINYDQLLEQHSNYKWLTSNEIMNEKNVHVNTIQHVQGNGLISTISF